MLVKLTTVGDLRRLRQLRVHEGDAGGEGKEAGQEGGDQSGKIRPNSFLMS